MTSVEQEKSPNIQPTLKNKVRAHRVSKELTDLANQFLAGDLKKFLFSILFKIIVLWIALVVIHKIFSLLEPACSTQCFTFDGQSCCWQSAWFIFRGGVFLLALFSASFIFTLKAEKNKFQESAIITSVMIISFIAVHFKFPLPENIFWVSLIVFYAIMFMGYRTAFNYRKRKLKQSSL